MPIIEGNRPSEGKRFMINKISELWCKRMHTKAMWPIHGKYICPQCLRTYPVAWEGTEPKPARMAASQPQADLQTTVSLYR